MRLKYLFVLLLMCRIFSFVDGEERVAAERRINEWLKGKKFVEMRQSSAMSRFSETQTVITIIAEG